MTRAGELLCWTVAICLVVVCAIGWARYELDQYRKRQVTRRRIAHAPFVQASCVGPLRPGALYDQDGAA